MIYVSKNLKSSLTFLIRTIQENFFNVTKLTSEKCVKHGIGTNANIKFPQEFNVSLIKLCEFYIWLSNSIAHFLLEHSTMKIAVILTFKVYYYLYIYIFLRLYGLVIIIISLKWVIKIYSCVMSKKNIYIILLDVHFWYFFVSQAQFFKY